jgi:hypothetical protein
MRAFVLTLAVGVLTALSAVAAEPLIFHTAHFDDNTVVNLGLVSNHTTERTGYDYDVLISLSQGDAASGSAYTDPGKHRAFVKCSDPAKVSVRGIDYPVRPSDAGGDNWKDDLWRVVCMPSVS